MSEVEVIMEPILFIAKSQTMADLAAQITDKMEIEIAITISSRTEVQKVVVNYPDISVYISRGGTAKALRQQQGNIVVELRPTLGELLEPIHKIASKGINKIAVVASTDLIGESIYDFEIANAEIYIRPSSIEGFGQVLHQLSCLGVQGVIGGRAVSKIAETYGMIVEGLEVGAASIKQAIIEATQIVKMQEIERMREHERVQNFKSCSAVLYSDIERAAVAVQQLAASSQELAATSQGTAKIAENAGREVKRTAEILSIIKHVAQQSSLLGLNAAIEAARVGEHGRGFSVVANEVRKLADESNNSVRTINDMLNQIRNSVGQVLKDVEQCNVISQAQAKANQEISEMLESLRGVGKKLLDLVANRHAS
jgi:methyl-accepting chemotaxis protein